MRFVTASLLLVIVSCAPRATPSIGTPPPETPVTTSPGLVPTPDATVKFRDRTIDLRPFLEGYPFKTFLPDLDADRLFFFEEADRTLRLKSVPLPESGEADLSKGKAVLAEDVDWNTRSFRWAKYHPASKSMVMLGDEKNDEVFNLFKMSLAEGTLERITDKEYIYGFALDAKKETVGYIPRYGKTEPYKSCFNLLAFGGVDTEVACDSKEMPLTWAEPVFRPDGSGVLLETNLGGDRARGNVVYLDFATKEFTLLTDGKAKRSIATPFTRWLDGDRFLYVSDETGFTEVWVYDMKKKSGARLTRFDEELGSWAPIVVGGRLYAAVIVKRPWESELRLVDPRDGKVVLSSLSTDDMAFLDYGGERAWVRRTSVKTWLEIDEWRFAPHAAGGIALVEEPRVRLPSALREKVEQCDVTRVKYRTFDVDPKTDKPRLLHAYLFTPKKPPEEKDRFALVRAFYGGENVWSMETQVICAAGGVALSPAVRGSDGFGREFYALNDKDLGGNEIYDVVYGARWLATRFGIPENRIGPWGRSHGGYATMRLLTMPPGVNGRTEKLDWGFGIADAGFSDIVTFYEACNIPDWVKLEAGDPKTEEAKLKDRSPLSHVDELKAPILLMHGENDNRVPVRESRQFAEKAKALGKPVVYVEFAGQGHNVRGLENETRMWQERFGFLESALAAPVATGTPQETGR